MKRGFMDFIRDQRGGAPDLIAGDVDGKTIMVIGANTGIGFEACVHFAKLKPARLIMTSRNKAKGEDALRRLASATNYAAELRLVDLSDFNSIRSFLDGVEKDGVRLDLLVLNAAVVSIKYELSKEGFESSLQVNCISMAWLALRLLPNLQESSKTRKDIRIIIVASNVHYMTNLGKAKKSPKIMEKMNEKAYCTPSVMRSRYQDTKLIVVFLVLAIAERLDPSSVLITMLEPGFCNSELGKDIQGLYKSINSLMKRTLGFTPEEGSRQIIYASTAGQHDENYRKQLHGGYVHLNKLTEPSDLVISAEGKQLQERLWDETVAILSKQDPKIPSIVRECLRTPPRPIN